MLVVIGNLTTRTEPQCPRDILKMKRDKITNGSGTKIMKIYGKVLLPHYCGYHYNRTVLDSICLYIAEESPGESEPKNGM